MRNVYSVYKPRGMTPYQIIQQLKKNNKELKDQKIAYAERLDPMAEGVLVLLVGEECKKRKEYERLPKEYEFTVLFGIETDTYDTLGIIASFKELENQSHLTKNLEEFIKAHMGKQTQEYPPFSSPIVQGKPLYKWAREGKIEKIKIPEKEIEIYSFNLKQTSHITRDVLIDLITHYVQKVNGVFRQEEILEKWISFFKENQIYAFPCVTFSVSCSSGTYVRSLAHEMGKQIGCGALALEIKRTRVGEYALEKSIRL